MAKNIETKKGTRRIFDGPRDPERYETEEETCRRLRSMIRVLTTVIVTLGSSLYKASAWSVGKSLELSAALLKSKERLEYLDNKNNKKED